MNNPTAEVRDDNHPKKNSCFRQFWVKGPRHSENASDEKCYLCRSPCRPFVLIGSTTVDGDTVKPAPQQTVLLANLFLSLSHKNVRNTLHMKTKVSTI